MSNFRLQIVTPDGSAFDAQAEALRVRTTEGYVSIRAGHADYLAALDIGVVTITQDGKSRDAACGGGFLSVEKGSVRLVATTFEYAEEIDVERAKLAQEHARERLKNAKEEREAILARAKLLRALNRIEVSKK